VAPTLVDFNSPPLNNNIVGIPLTPYFVGVLGSLSILCFAITISLAISLDISSKVGPICLHGPHHSAQKSTRIGFSDFKTMTSKDNLELRDRIELIVEEYFQKKNFDYKNYFKI